jgi:hypothetical protein
MHNRGARPTRKIVAVAHDIGGAQAIYPVIARLRRRPNLRVNVVAGGFAQKVFARFRPENATTDWSESEIDKYLDQNRPDLLLSATSWKSTLEQGFRNRADVRRIPSVVVIDFWSNYRSRWHDATYRFEDSQDRVCVMDQQTAAVMSSEGYPPALLHVTGQPHLERRFQRGFQRQPPLETKREIHVLFLTISLIALGLKDDPVVPIQIVCQALHQWSITTKKNVLLTIRPHPHEKPEPDFLERVRAIAPSGVTVRMADRTQPILGQLKKSDLVLGYITMGLFEARSLGKQAIAIQLADHPPELLLAMENAGIELVSFDPDCIAALLCRSNSETLDQPSNRHIGATAAVAGLCCSLMAGNLKNPVKPPAQAIKNGTV